MRHYPRGNAGKLAKGLDSIRIKIRERIEVYPDGTRFRMFYPLGGMYNPAIAELIADFVRNLSELSTPAEIKRSLAALPDLESQCESLVPVKHLER